MVHPAFISQFPVKYKKKNKPALAFQGNYSEGSKDTDQQRGTGQRQVSLMRRDNVIRLSVTLQ